MDLVDHVKCSMILTVVCLCLGFNSFIFAATRIEDASISEEYSDAPLEFPRVAGSCNLAVGSTCGEYTFKQELGKGGFGSVFKADHTDGKEYVLKAVSIQAGDNEIKILKSLNHPGIRKVVDYFQNNENRFIVFDTDRAITLAEFIRILKYSQSTPYLSIEEIRLFGANLLCIIDYLQLKGIANNDIKPENILVDKRTGSIIMIDFGSSKKFTSKGERFWGSVGTRYFSVPEFTDSRPNFLAEADFYTLGTCLAYLVMKNVPVYSDMMRHPGFKSDEESKDLLKLIVKLCEYKEKDRLVDSEEIKNQPFFLNKVDWERVKAWEVPPFAEKVEQLKAEREKMEQAQIKTEEESQLE